VVDTNPKCVPNTHHGFPGQLEYEYAIGKDKPFFACVVTEKALEKRVKVSGTAVVETINGQKLKDFRASVLSKMVKLWEDSKDIKIAVGETLFQFSRREEITGWVRQGDEANLPALHYGKPGRISTRPGRMLPVGMEVLRESCERRETKGTRRQVPGRLCGYVGRAVRR
jgi:hypothetical protein